MKHLLVLALLFWPSFVFAQGINNPCVTTASTTVPGCTAYGTAAGTAAQGNDSRITSITANGTAAVGQIPGTTTNDNAAAGKVGEIITATLASGSAISLTNGTSANVTSISLTAGDWDVNGTVFYVTTGTTVTQALVTDISVTSATTNTAPGLGSYTYFGGSFTGLAKASSTGTSRISISVTTTVYLVVSPSFTVSTATAYGFLRARRVR